MSIAPRADFLEALAIIAEHVAKLRALGVAVEESKRDGDASSVSLRVVSRGRIGDLTLWDFGNLSRTVLEGMEFILDDDAAWVLPARTPIDGFFAFFYPHPACDL